MGTLVIRRMPEVIGVVDIHERGEGDGGLQAIWIGPIDTQRWCCRNEKKDRQEGTLTHQEADPQ